MNFSSFLCITHSLEQPNSNQGSVSLGHKNDPFRPSEAKVGREKLPRMTLPKLDSFSVFVNLLKIISLAVCIENLFHHTIESGVTNKAASS